MRVKTKDLLPAGGDAGAAVRAGTASGRENGSLTSPWERFRRQPRHFGLPGTEKKEEKKKDDNNKNKNKNPLTGKGQSGAAARIRRRYIIVVVNAVTGVFQQSAVVV